MLHCALRPHFGTHCLPSRAPVLHFAAPPRVRLWLPGPACTVSGGLASAPQAVSLAHENHQTWLRDSVRPASSQVQGRSVHLCVEQGCPSLACGSRGPAGEGRDRAGPSSRDEVGVLQPVLHRTQERRWVTTNLGPARPEPGPSQAPVQDADAETHFSMHPSVRLVRSDRPEGRVLSCLDPPSTQTVSSLCVRRASISVQSPPLRAIPVASCLHQGRGGSPCSIKGSGHSRSQLPRRLAHIGPVSSTVVRTQGHGAQPPQPVGASGQLGKEQTLPCAEDLFSRYGVGLGQPHSTSLSGACSVDAELPGVFPVQEGGSTETLSEAPGAYGIRSRCHAARIASYETASALASRPGPEMGMATRYVPGFSHPVLPSDLRPVVGSCFSSGRSSPRASIQACCCINRCLCHGLGSHVQRACSCRALDRVPVAVAYQLPRVASSTACSAPLQRAATRQACTGPYGQHCDRCVHQPPRWSTLPSPVATRPPSPPLESEASEVASRRSYPWRAQSCSRRALTSARPSGRMATPPRGTPADLETLRDAQVDLFASPDTFHCQLFYSLSEGTLGTDALAHSWPRGLRKYAFPPVSLLAQILCKVREDEEQVLLVAPYWPNRTWFPELMLLATAPPWQIPLRRDLLSQRGGTLWHPRPDLWNLHVWSLDGTRRF